MLTDLDDSGFLSGQWAVVINAAGSPAYSGDKTFLYSRNDERFEQAELGRRQAQGDLTDACLVAGQIDLDAQAKREGTRWTMPLWWQNPMCDASIGPRCDDSSTLGLVRRCL